MLESVITLVGNVVADPTIRITSNGVPVASFRIACTPRVRDRETAAWRDGETLFVGVSCWRTTAEHSSQCLRRGDRVIVTGRLRMRSYETRDGDKRTVYEVEADAVGPDLSRCPVDVRRPVRVAAGDQSPGGTGDPAGSDSAGDTAAAARTAWASGAVPADPFTTDLASSPPAGQDGSPPEVSAA